MSFSNEAMKRYSIVSTIRGTQINSNYHYIHMGMVKIKFKKVLIIAGYVEDADKINLSLIAI
jgi:F0F1-type ATP synthase epsilon subunit